MSKKKWFNNAGSRWGRLGDNFFKMYERDEVTGIMHITPDIGENNITGQRFDDKKEGQVVKGINEIMQIEEQDVNRVIFSLSSDNLKRILENNAEIIEFSVSTKRNNTKSRVATKDEVIIIRYINHGFCDDMTLVAPMRDRTNIEDIF